MACFIFCQTVAPDEKYEVKSCVEEAAIIVSSMSEPKITVTVTLTSPVMRESNTETNAAGGMFYYLWIFILNT